MSIDAGASGAVYLGTSGAAIEGLLRSPDRAQLNKQRENA